MAVYVLNINPKLKEPRDDANAPSILDVQAPPVRVTSKQIALERFREAILYSSFFCLISHTPSLTIGPRLSLSPGVSQMAPKPSFLLSRRANQPPMLSALHFPAHTTKDIPFHTCAVRRDFRAE
ncbi:hypothetical protein N7486_006373 [Penicillium sp. IBT 16267x]|nr:hypothetical protein N7486_006373 [Penicillium sp. IBT 16267x]